MPRPRPFRFDRSWTFATDPASLWTVLSRTDEFPLWWSWLDRFVADGIHPGAEAQFDVRARLGYSLHFKLVLERVVPPAEIAASVDGDLAGSAVLQLEPDPAASATSATSIPSTRARLRWTLMPRARSIELASIVARPLLIWSHDRIVDLGVRQFEQRALSSSRPQPRRASPSGSRPSPRGSPPAPR